ncbi:unnamed protein product [Ambrosiozyma monospora]|uniref:Unnamed protein product n=1 Tax=Ambrosiozyma monospora TaxID=43982 RepID=A0A9W6Z4Z7_AMBMO|nr:unnamed protein product [Ambrosiozyma monospora]
MGKDSDFSYIHMQDPSHILFSEQWEQDNLPFDDIDIPPQFFQPSTSSNDINNGSNLLQQFLSTPEDHENDMNLMNGNNPMFSSSQINRSRQLKNKRLNWQELGISEFTSSGKSGGKRNGNGPGHGQGQHQYKRDHVPDLTILKRPIFTSSNEFNDGDEDGLLGASFDYSNQITTTANIE